MQVIPRLTWAALSQKLTFTCNELLSSLAFSFNCCPYVWDGTGVPPSAEVVEGRSIRNEQDYLYEESLRADQAGWVFRTSSRAAIRA